MNPTIEKIIGEPSLAVVGVSDRDFGGEIYKTLKKRGIAVYPVHPTREAFDGDRCYANLTLLPEGVRAAVIAVSPTAAEQVVEDAAQAGMAYLWFQQGKNFVSAVAKAQARGMETVSGKCILMYAGKVTGVHSFHRGLVRLFGRL